ncbi:hybrid sensor histidine kinase/response regulator [Shewanella psychrotolerans]|uniref:hybrid sensor histidine kinase/response regulator n=1 Tax=Shewanella psychrotolerans TaxID=2864206 RepID=UPI0021AD330D|nr:ATP-binding protein [Shewanella psychrotolerans]
MFKDLAQSEFTDFGPRLIAQIGRLQASFIKGEDIFLPLCRVLAEISGAESVLILSSNQLVKDEMPAEVTCWCRDSVRFITLWRQVKQWPFVCADKVVHQWQSFTVWPIDGQDFYLFFLRPADGWFVFLNQFHRLFADAMAGMLVQQSIDWHSYRDGYMERSIDAEIYQSIVSNSEDLIVVASRGLGNIPVIMYANTAATSISQYPRSQLIGKPISLFFNSDDMRVRELFDAIALHQDFDEELECITATGETVIMHTHLVALNDQSMDGSLFTLVGRDITQQKLLQHTMARTQKMQAIGQLVGGVAHDFNNILGVLKGNLELMGLKNRDDCLNRYLATALKACQRGTDLTRRLLQFSRQEQFSAQPLQVNDVIDSLEELIGKSLTSQVQLDIKESREMHDVCVDRGDLEDALINLVLNAKDAMGGEGVITIETGEKYLSGKLPGVGNAVLTDNRDYVWVSVIDHGTGIDKAILDKVFEPFFTTKDKSKGTGLGLSMVYGFVKRSNGYMSIMDTSDEGTEIRLWFPAMKSATVHNPRPLKHLTYPTVSSPFKVLIVDDEPDLLEVLKDYCQMMGMEVCAYTDPVMVREQYRNRIDEFNLLISDVLMPGGLNGYELAVDLCQNSQVPVLLISGFVGDIGISRREELPFEVLQKPFDFQAFVKGLEGVGVQFRKGER